MGLLFHLPLSAAKFAPVQPQNTPSPVAIQPTASLEPLTLETVWQLVEANHPELAQAALKQRIAQANLLEKQGAFDPRLTADPFYQRYNSSTSRGKTGEGYGVDSTVEILTRSGAKLFAGAAWNDGLVKSPASSTGEAGTYTVGLDIPLLRGGWGRNEKAFAERTARIKIPLTGADVQAKRLELLGKSAKAYWSWWAASQKVTVGREVLGLAQTRLGQVQRLASAGDVPAIDAVEADLAVQQRLGALAVYEQELTTAALDLAYFLWRTPEQPISTPPVAGQVPTLTSLPVIPDDTALAEQLVNALQNLPQFAQIRFQKDLVALD